MISRNIIKKDWFFLYLLEIVSQPVYKSQCFFRNPFSHFLTKCESNIHKGNERVDVTNYFLPHSFWFWILILCNFLGLNLTKIKTNSSQDCHNDSLWAFEFGFSLNLSGNFFVFQILRKIGIFFFAKSLCSGSSVGRASLFRSYG